MPQAKSALLKKPQRTPQKPPKKHKAQQYLFLFNTPLFKFELQLDETDEKLHPVLSGKPE